MTDCHLPDEYEWDEAKRQENLAKHAIDFTAIRNFEWDTAVYNGSPRHGEMRWVAIGYIGPRLHFAVYTIRHGKTRIISLRKANQREERIYAQAEPDHISPTDEEDAAITAAIAADPDTFELDAEWFTTAKSFHEVYPNGINRPPRPPEELWPERFAAKQQEKDVAV